MNTENINAADLGNVLAETTTDVQEYEITDSQMSDTASGAMSLCGVPIIDPTVKHVGVSKLRELNATKLKENDDTLVIQDNDTPLAVLVSYKNYLIMQEQLLSIWNTVELLSDQSEVAGVQAGLREIAAGKSRSFAEIKAGLRKLGRKKHAQSEHTQTDESKAGD